MRVTKSGLIKVTSFAKSRIIALLVCFVFVLIPMSVSAKENVVSLPYMDNIPSFVPYYWQSQHILAQGTIFEGLFGYAPDANGLGGVKVVPVIATTWEVSPDGKVWKINLRKDKKWSNGDPVTAMDFEWSYKYMCDPSIPDVPLWANQLQYILNGWTVKAGGLPLDALGVKATSDYTLEFTLSSARFDFNCWLVVAGSMPLHRKTVEKYGNDWWKPGNIVCNGPYIPTGWEANKQAILEKNKKYVGECGNVDKIILKCYPTSLSQIPGFQARELDAAFIFNVGDYKTVTKNKTLKASLVETPSDLFWSGYQLSRCFDPIYDNKKVRQAFAMSIDRVTLCNTVLNGRAAPMSSYWPDNNMIGKKLVPIPYDPAGARKLLAEAGYANGKGLPPLKFYITSPMPEVEFIVDQWKKNLGVTVQIENLESGVYLNQYVWANYTPEASPGFVRINGPMNSFEAGSLDKNASHTLWFYDIAVSARKKWYDLEQERIQFLTATGGLTETDWKPMAAKKDELFKSYKVMIGKEKHKAWLEDLSREPTFDKQYNEVYANFKKATTDKDRNEQWINANRILLEQEKVQTEYNGMNESNKQARRLRMDMLNSPFDEAIELSPPCLQIMQDQYYMVPLFVEKAQYLLNKRITGFMLYKFSWGPNVAFNYKYLNVK